MSMRRNSFTRWSPNTSNQLAHGPLYYDVLDHFMEAEQASRARSELIKSTLMSQLRPARTIGDAKLQDMFRVLNMNDRNIPMARGDKITFLSHEIRKSDNFQCSHPEFSIFLSRFEEKIRNNISDIQSLILSDKTSVQIAVYPGDGKSGYPQHCDLSAACSQEFPKLGKDDHRIVTAVYYFTPSDWSEDHDGGHLHLSFDNHHYSVVPFFNRLVLFRSDKVLHEVLPSMSRDRIAMTMWFYGRPRQDSAQIETLRASIYAPPMSQIIFETESSPRPLTIGINPDTSSTIFVSIASYRDSETIPTIQSLLKNALNSSRIRIGLVWQYDAEDEPALPISSDSRIRCLSLEAKDARGPCYARRLAQLLYCDEDFVLQIDSHMRFRPNWDAYLIEHLPSGKSMFTTYPVGYKLPNQIPDETRPTLLVPWKFDSLGMLRQRGHLLQDISSGPIPTRLYAAGFNFAPGFSISDCPYPTYRVFFGEEVYRAIQFHEQGYELWSPSETVAYHLWSRSHRPVFQADDTHDDRNKMQKFFDENVSESIWNRMGVDWKNKKIRQNSSSNSQIQPNRFVEWVDGDVGLTLSAMEETPKAIILSFLGL
jgi:[Skp1-protein]-hydroxyproline N-acetylglucosaminyltransferase